MSAADSVLAGPALRRLTPRELCIWVATRDLMLPGDLIAEVWTPAVSGYLAIDEPVSNPFGAAALFAASASHESLPLLPNLWLNLIRVRPMRPFQPGVVYAYRVGVGGFDVGSDTATLQSPILERLLRSPPDPKPPKFPSFVPSAATQWWWWAIAAGSAAMLTDAGTKLDAMVKHAPRPPKPGPLPAPDGLIFLGRPWTFDASLPAEMAAAIRAFAAELAGNGASVTQKALAQPAAAYLLASSSNLWNEKLVKPGVPGADTYLPAITATERLVANTPTYWLPGFIKEQNDLPSALALAAADAAFARWPSSPDDPQVADVLPMLSLVTSRLLGSRFEVRGANRVWFLEAGSNPAEALTLSASPARIVTMASAVPLLRPDPLPAGLAAPTKPTLAETIAVHDVTLMIGLSESGAYIADNKKSPNPRDPDPERYSTRNAGNPKGRAYEVCASLGVAALPPDPASAGGGLNTRVRTATASWAALKRTGSHVWLSLWQGGNEVSPQLVELPGHGRLVEIPGGPVGLHLGNRLVHPSSLPDLKEGYGDKGEMKDVELGVYEISKSATSLPPKARARASDTGLVPLVLAGVPDGTYELRVEQGPKTFTHAGPDTPILDGVHFRKRVYRRHAFPIEVQNGALVSIDHEPLPAKSYRLLIDPVWMWADKLAHGVRTSVRLRGEAASVTARPLVDLVILHSTDGDGDIRSSLTNWIAGTKVEGPHYVVGRDGTLVKVVDESLLTYHARPGRWRENPEVTTSHYTTRPTLNVRSVGIEQETKDGAPSFNAAMYESLLPLLERLVGLDTPAPGATQARARVQGRTDYVDIAVGPTEVIGHGDNRLRDDCDALGGKADPWLPFDWGLLEAQGIGLRRAAPPAPLTGDGPSGPIDSKGRWAPTPAWDAQIQADTTEYANMSDHRDAQGRLMEPNNQAIRKLVFAHLTEIGYWVGPNAHDSGNIANPSAQPRNRVTWFEVAVQAFRTHFYSAARRTRANKDEETSALDRPTVMWIRRVAEFLRTVNRP